MRAPCVGLVTWLTPAKINCCLPYLFAPSHCTPKPNSVATACSLSSVTLALVEFWPMKSPGNLTMLSCDGCRLGYRPRFSNWSPSSQSRATDSVKETNSFLGTIRIIVGYLLLRYILDKCLKSDMIDTSCRLRRNTCFNCLREIDQFYWTRRQTQT